VVEHRSDAGSSARATLVWLNQTQGKQVPEEVFPEARGMVSNAIFTHGRDPTSTGVVTVGALSAAGPNAPSFRVRTKIPSAELGRHGVLIEHVPLLDDDEDRRVHHAGIPVRATTALRARNRLRRRLAAVDWDVSLIQRQVDLFPTLELERKAAMGHRLVFDVDDAIWLDSSREAGGHRLALLKGTPRKVRWLAAHAETVIAGNDLLAEWLSQHSANVKVVPSLVEHRDVPVRSHEPSDRVVLGWIGSPTTATYLRQVAEPLARLRMAAPGVRFELIAVGGIAPEIPGLDVRSEPWSEEGEQRFLTEVDIGLMPLEDSPWARGKSSYKALQYMAAGIPVVADDVGISASVIGHEAAGLISRSQDDWVEHVGALARDAGLRSRLGTTGRMRIAADFSVERWAPELAAILRGDES
jgi:glycosyltransferase involved in cell wall biosynthesis